MYVFYGITYVLSCDSIKKFDDDDNDDDANILGFTHHNQCEVTSYYAIEPHCNSHTQITNSRLWDRSAGAG